jgi:hypothetical protein
LDELRYARERTQKPLNVTLPSPGIIAGGFWGEPSKDAYPDPPERIADVGEAVKQ